MIARSLRLKDFVAAALSHAAEAKTLAEGETDPQVRAYSKGFSEGVIETLNQVAWYLEDEDA